MSEEIEQEDPQGVVYEECDTRLEIINECHTALSSLEMLDPSMLGKKAERQVRNIRRRCLDVLDYYIKELHDEIFEEDEGED